MTRLAARVCAIALTALLAFGSTLAWAGYPNNWHGVLSDCGAGHYPLVGHYSLSSLDGALAHLSGSNAEYSNCYQSIEAARRALLAKQIGAGTHHHGTPPRNNGGGPVLPSRSAITPIYKRIHYAISRGSKPVKVGDRTITPGVVAARGSSLLPTPWLIVLAALLASLVAAGGVALQRIVRARRTR
ncbi:MAG: hypothetical protein ACRDLP_16255 [Solirubrobacteraceae bacterium]